MAQAPNMWMPYAPAIKVKGGTTVYLAGASAVPVYRHHPHGPEEFNSMPSDIAGQARATLEDLKRSLSAVGTKCWTGAIVIAGQAQGTMPSDSDVDRRA